MRLFLPFLLTASFVHTAFAEVRWNSKVRESYESEAEGARVSFNVQTPPEVESMETYPLLIALSGGLRVSPSEQFPFFQANPTRTRIWGYRAISTYDAMQVVDVMLRKYPIDPNRIYLMGSSAGGSGAMHLASCYPDRFAAVLAFVAAGNNYPLANFRNLPVAFHHGDQDWTSAVCNVRVQVQRMQALSCPVLYREYKGAGHSVPGPHEPLMAWLFEQKRNPVPTTITHDCEAPSLGRSYWFHIRELDDPHQRAKVEATIEGQSIQVRPQNIASFSLETELLPGITSVQIGDTRLAARNHYALQNGRWNALGELPGPSTRIYEAGAAANLYQGEPLLIVYGTGGDRTNQLKAAAQKLSKCGGPDYSAIPGAFPVVTDVDLTPAQQATHNLLLIGTPDDNSVSRQLLPRLSIRIEEGNLLAGDRPKLPLQNQVLSLLHPHPHHPERLIYLLAPFTDGSGLAQFTSKPVRFLSGSDGFDRVSQADLLVQNTQHQMARQMQFDKDWKWLRFPHVENRIPSQYAERSSLATTYMEIMTRKSDADFALWWGPADKGMWGADFNDLESYNPDFYTEADFRTQRRDYETTLATVSGADLKIVWNRWGINHELQSVPEVDLDTIEDGRQYSVHIPMDLYIKLGQRRKNLGDPTAGPAVPAGEVLKSIFR